MVTTQQLQVLTAIGLLGKPRRINLPRDWVFGPFGINAAIVDNTQTTAIDLTNWSSVTVSPKIAQHYAFADNPPAGMLLTGLRADVVVHGEEGDLSVIQDTLRNAYIEWTHRGTTRRIDLYPHVSGFENAISQSDTTASTLSVRATLHERPMTGFPVDVGYILIDLEKDTFALDGQGNVDTGGDIEVELVWEGVVFPNTWMPEMDSALGETDCGDGGMEEEEVIQVLKGTLARAALFARNPSKAMLIG